MASSNLNPQVPALNSKHRSRVESEGGAVRRLGDEGGACFPVEAALPGGGVRRSEGAALDARPAANQEARRAFKSPPRREPAPGIICEC